MAGGLRPFRELEIVEIESAWTAADWETKTKGGPARVVEAQVSVQRTDANVRHQAVTNSLRQATRMLP